jgi:hypothetical protein
MNYHHHMSHLLMMMMIPHLAVIFQANFGDILMFWASLECGDGYTVFGEFWSGGFGSESEWRGEIESECWRG